MWLKIIIVILFLAVLASLSSALVYLLKDVGAANSKRTLYALGIRITLAACSRVASSPKGTYQFSVFATPIPIPLM